MRTQSSHEEGIRHEPLILGGYRALSPFRIDLLLKRARETASLDIEAIEANFIYLVRLRGSLSDQAMDRTLSLLGAAGVLPAEEAGTGFFVAPRKGSISPWSSKATDIFHNCGISEVARVERGMCYRLSRRVGGTPFSSSQVGPVLRLFHDRMTQAIYDHGALRDYFTELEPRPFKVVDILKDGIDALRRANVETGLALSDDEIEYLFKRYSDASRNPTDAELVMFGQVNSEHCRHKIFRADWTLDGRAQDRTLFDMIRNTHALHPAGTLVAYSDNAAVIEGFDDEWFRPDPKSGLEYGYERDLIDIVMKVETHNHPTAISPYPGAATGIGGEIRDESATGRGGKSKAGLSGFMVSNLRIPGHIMPWEEDASERPSRLATALEIMLEGPIGGAAFGNEFGRPQLAGFFKTLELHYNGRYCGYHKPIMIAGGMGVIKREHSGKKDIEKGMQIIQIGGPALRIGLGGGAASSMATGSNVEDLDYDSVQRDNAEMQRRCQEVIEGCIALGDRNPIVSIHDLGAGGLSNGCPELVAESGGTFWLRKIPNEEPSMSPMEIWCCEAQERYVLAVHKEALETFLALSARERCPAAVIGEAMGDGRLKLYDEHFKNTPIDMELQVLLGKPPKMQRVANRLREPHSPLDLSGIILAEAVDRILRIPSVSNKTFLVTIADRTVMGMTARDQMVGPYQTPIADAAVVTMSYRSHRGSAMAIGERSDIALVSAPASGRMAVGEAITNICSSWIGDIGNVKLSANWMCACGEVGEDANLYDTVRAIGMEFCPALGVSIPVGKDSLSMRTLWETSGGVKEKMSGPLSLVVSSFAPVLDVRRTVTPDLKRTSGSQLVLLDLGRGKNRLGCSALARAYGRAGNECPDADDPALLASFFAAVQDLIGAGMLLAYHDRSDGGLLGTLVEMAIGGRVGVEIEIGELGCDPFAALFNEELGAVLQIEAGKLDAVMAILARHSLSDCAHRIGETTGRPVIAVSREGRELMLRSLTELNRAWSELTCLMQQLRDNPECAREEYDNILDEGDPGLSFKLTDDPGATVRPAKRRSGKRPRVAVLREQGINGHVEMAAAFDAAGFTACDVHMTDLHNARVDLSEFDGLVACGGFSYGDVLGAGAGWARSILFNAELKKMFARFFEREDTFSLGVCNGCQMLAQLTEIIPGTELWPTFGRNRSEQFEARYVTVEVLESPSIFLKGMVGSRLGIPVAHGEGRAVFENEASVDRVIEAGLAALRYVDNRGLPTERYPFNPNGSPGGITSLTSADGRATIMMPHPERAFRSVQCSYACGDPAIEEGPWLRMFLNAREYVG